MILSWRLNRFHLILKNQIMLIRNSLLMAISTSKVHGKPFVLIQPNHKVSMISGIDQLPLPCRSSFGGCCISGFQLRILCKGAVLFNHFQCTCYVAKRGNQYLIFLCTVHSHSKSGLIFVIIHIVDLIWFNIGRTPHHFLPRNIFGMSCPFWFVGLFGGTEMKSDTKGANDMTTATQDEHGVHATRPLQVRKANVRIVDYEVGY